MKNKLFISGLFFILFLISSCSSDEYYEIPEEKSIEFTIPSNIKIPSDATMKDEVSGAIIITNDSTVVVPTTTEETPTDGEPSNPKPPRNG